MLIRNNDADMITDMRAAGKLRVRMIASKTKGRGETPWESDSA